jgi:hypothetical protein
LAAIENTQACAADTWLASDAMPARSLSATNPVATTPSPRDGQGLAQGICDQLQQMIYGGEIAAGERLNEAALALQSAYPSATSCRWPRAAAATCRPHRHRALGQGCSSQSFVVDNQSGGGGVVACQATARAAPDGYTLLQGYVATHGTSPATRKVPYDAVKDFTPSA